jgi:hypothetical protein
MFCVLIAYRKKNRASPATASSGSKDTSFSTFSNLLFLFTFYETGNFPSIKGFLRRLFDLKEIKIIKASIQNIA